MDPQTPSSDVPDSYEPLTPDPAPADPSTFPDPEGEAAVKAISDKVQSMYDSGVPLFTKDAIRHAANQLALYHARPRDDRQVTLIDMTGKSVEYTICLPFPNHRSDEKSDIEMREYSIYICQFNCCLSN
jgi:hypothetical protein